MGDLISRQAAIDALIEQANHEGAYGYIDAKEAEEILTALPPAQPEHTMEEFMYGQDLGSPEDGSL